MGVSMEGKDECSVSSKNLDEIKKYNILYTSIYSTYTLSIIYLFMIQSIENIIYNKR